MNSIERFIASNDRLWGLYSRLVSASAARVLAARKDVLVTRVLDRLGPAYRVQQGLFEGMVYPRAASHGSALVPKLLGTYEIELAPVIEGWRDCGFPVIVDVGCAEGYYAVGLARMFPNAVVQAFDSAAEARAMCRQTSEANGVAGRMHIHGECGRDELLAIDLESGGLVVSDCEGFEGDLFDAEVARHLARCHAIIEVHDHPHDDHPRMKRLFAAFSGTHDLRIVHSVDDLQKARYYRSDRVSADDLLEREVAFAEWRPWIMHWLVAEPKRRLPD